MIFEYLIFNIVIILGPILVYLFGTNKMVKPNSRSMIYAILIGAAFFVIWDELVIDYFWSFNREYIIGFLIGKIPIEEMLFFISVPFACLLLWVNYKNYISNKIIKNFVPSLIALSFFLSCTFLIYGKVYSGTVFFVFFGVVIIDILLKTNLFTKKSFIIFIFGITNLLTFIFNLYLTARPVVLYNELIKTNINLITIPMEDFIYGMALIALVIIIYEMRELIHGRSIDKK
jgi:lycopene cyclase domain-containing protein